MKDVCGKRIWILGVHPAWCIEPANHEGECRGVTSSRPHLKPDFMPRKK